MAAPAKPVARTQPGAQPKVQPIPERPRLASGVKPAGQFEESAFVEPPWLIEREGSGYVHVTRLIYQVAELCTGEHTYEDIARKLSNAGTPVQPQTIQRLVGGLLIPRGLVVGVDGSVAEVEDIRGLSRINIRTKEISPEAVEPVTTVLRWFYWPPVMAALLLAAVMVQGWLYFVHGVAGGLRDTLNYPGLMLLILLFVIAAAAFHELGHAAALHYAGQRTKGMGAGLYLVYPAFYTDVSNNYRLRRWPRLRTDLGGFYFNLIFVLGVIGAYALTGQEFLLLVVLLINFEIVHQLLPFLRLDGYWALADITGVPDFLSHMSAFVRGLVPGRRRPEQQMPPLKWWGKAIFAGYVLISVPLAGFLIFVLVRAAPRAFATAYRSALNQSHGFQGALAQGDGLGMTAALVQILLLAIPTLGLAYTLVLLGKRLFGAIWVWSQPTWPRRAAGTLASTAICGLLVWLWAPSLPAPGGGQPQPGPAYAAAASQFDPIRDEEQGTIGEAVSNMPWNTPAPVAPPVASATASPRAGSPTPEASTTPAVGEEAAATPMSDVATPVPTPVMVCDTATGRCFVASATPQAAGTPVPAATVTPAAGSQP